MIKKSVEVCLTPALFNRFENKEAIVVIIDVLRASSAICTAFSNGALKIIPVAEIDVAREYKNKGYLVAAERDGFVLDFADFGNSPFNFTREKVEGKTIVYSTTNGTCKPCKNSTVGSSSTPSSHAKSGSGTSRSSRRKARCHRAETGAEARDQRGRQGRDAFRVRP